MKDLKISLKTQLQDDTYANEVKKAMDMELAWVTFAQSILNEVFLQ